MREIFLAGMAGQMTQLTFYPAPLRSLCDICKCPPLALSHGTYWTQSLSFCQQEPAEPTWWCSRLFEKGITMGPIIGRSTNFVTEMLSRMPELLYINVVYTTYDLYFKENMQPKWVISWKKILQFARSLKSHSHLLSSNMAPLDKYFFFKYIHYCSKL